MASVSSKETGNALRLPLPFAFISGCAPKQERYQLFPIVPRWDHRWWLRTGFWHQVALLLSRKEQESGQQRRPQRLLTLWRNWVQGSRSCWQLVLTLNHTRPDLLLINCVNCKEGALSKQADPKHCRIKEYPSPETPSWLPPPSIKIKTLSIRDCFDSAPHAALH